MHIIYIYIYILICLFVHVFIYFYDVRSQKPDSGPLYTSALEPGLQGLRAWEALGVQCSVGPYWVLVLEFKF